MNKYKNLFFDTFIFAIGSLGSKFILFFLVPLYTAYLTTSEYGTVELIDTVANFIIPITSVVIFDAIFRFTLDTRNDKKSVILNAFIVYFIGSLFAIICAPIIGMYSSLNEWKWFVSIYVILHMGTQICLTYIKAQEKVKLYVTLSLLQTVLLAILNIILLTVFNLNIYGFLYSNILANIIITMITLIKGEIIKDLYEAKFNKILFYKMIAYSSPLILNNISWWFIQSSNKMMIELFINSAALGLYTVASKIPALINVISSIFSQAWNISSIKEFDSSQDDKFYSNIFEMYIFSVFVFCMFLLTIIKPFMNFYVNETFFIAWKYIPFLLIAAAFSAVSAYFSAIYSALKKSLNVMYSTLFSAIINTVLNYLLIPKIGVLGSTIATAISYLFIAIYRMYDTRKYFKFKINFLCLYINISILILTAILVTMDLGYYYYIALNGIFIFINIDKMEILYFKVVNFINSVLNKKQKEK